jgi:hypothetical protein
MSEIITYNTILKYLSPVHKKQSTFPNKPNLVIDYNEFPTMIKSYLKNFYRYGVKSHNTEGDNISFLSSVLASIDKKFLVSDNEESFKLFHEEMEAFVQKSGNYNTYNYNLTGLTKSTILCKIKEKVSPIYMQIVCDLLNINIIIINFDTCDKTCYYSGVEFNLFFPTIFLAYSNEYYEPIFYKEKKYFNYNDRILEKVMSSTFTIVPIGTLQKDFIIVNDVSILLDNMFNINNDSDNDSIIEHNSEKDSELNNINKSTLLNLSANKLKKKRKEDIIEIANSLNITIDVKNKKDDIIETIIKHI